MFHALYVNIQYFWESPPLPHLPFHIVCHWFTIPGIESMLTLNINTRKSHVQTEPFSCPQNPARREYRVTVRAGPAGPEQGRWSDHE